MNGLIEVQKAIRARLVATPAVTTLVTADNIVDGIGIPQAFPCIILGDDQAVNRLAVIGRPSSLRWVMDNLFVNLHLWTRGGGMIAVKELAAKVRHALHDELPVDSQEISLDMTTCRFLRDPDGVSCHAVLSYRAIWQEGVT